MYSLKEAGARVRGVDPAARRLAVGLSAIVGDKDGNVIEVFPDGTRTILDKGSSPTTDIRMRRKPPRSGLANV